MTALSATREPSRMRRTSAPASPPRRASFGSSTRSSSRPTVVSPRSPRFSSGSEIAKAFGVAGHHEGVQALAVAGGDQEVTGAVAQGHQGLGPREHEGVALGLRHGARPGGVEERPGLHHRQGRRVELLGAEEGEKGLLLVLGAEVEHSVREARGRDRGRRQAGVAEGELLEHDDVRHRRTLLAAAAVALGNLRGGETEVPDALEQLGRDFRRLVAIACDRADLLRREVAHRLPNHFLLFGGSKRDHCGSPSFVARSAGADFSCWSEPLPTERWIWWK